MVEARDAQNANHVFNVFIGPILSDQNFLETEMLFLGNVIDEVYSVTLAWASLYN